MRKLHELEATINAAECDVVVTGTPMNLGRLIEIKHPVRHATCALEDHGEPTLAQTLEPFIRAHTKHPMLTA